MRGEGDWRICGELGLRSYSTHGAIVTAGTVHMEKAERGASRVGGVQGTSAAGLLPRSTREKGFPSNLLLD
jgi:hypothetical protein